jgi:hypothetical protein
MMDGSLLSSLPGPDWLDLEAIEWIKLRALNKTEVSVPIIFILN